MNVALLNISDICVKIYNYTNDKLELNFLFKSVQFFPSMTLKQVFTKLLIIVYILLGQKMFIFK